MEAQPVKTQQTEDEEAEAVVQTPFAFSSSNKDESHKDQSVVSQLNKQQDDD